MDDWPWEQAAEREGEVHRERGGPFLAHIVVLADSGGEWTPSECGLDRAVADDRRLGWVGRFPVVRRGVVLRDNDFAGAFGAVVSVRAGDGVGDVLNDEEVGALLQDDPDGVDDGVRSRERQVPELGGGRFGPRRACFRRR